jgi:LysR family cyn operon transcriptional activator
MRMELRHLRYFVAIAEMPTMAKAAGAVHVTQSTLSHQLAQLEDDLGVPLFERIGRNLRLTDAGREFLGHARGILSQVEAGTQAIRRAGATVGGTLRVGVIHSFVTGLMPAVCSNCIKAWPDLRLQINELPGPEIEEQVAEGKLELGVGFFPPVHDGVVGEKIFEDVLVLAIPATHELAGRNSLRFTQLAGVPLAMLGQRFGTRKLIDRYFQRAGVKPDVVLEIDSVAALQHVVQHGVAAALLPGRVARREPGIKLIELLDPRPLRFAGLVWRRNAHHTPGALAFADQLRASVQAPGRKRSQGEEPGLPS